MKLYPDDAVVVRRASTGTGYPFVVATVKFVAAPTVALTGPGFAPNAGADGVSSAFGPRTTSAYAWLPPEGTVRPTTRTV